MSGVADTSLEAYIHRVLPHLNEKRTKVISVYFKYHLKSFTNREVAKKLGWDINRVTPRRGELVKLGLLEEKEKRACGVTGNNAWAVGLTWKGLTLRRKTRLLEMRER